MVEVGAVGAMEVGVVGAMAEVGAVGAMEVVVVVVVVVVVGAMEEVEVVEEVGAEHYLVVSSPVACPIARISFDPTASPSPPLCSTPLPLWISLFAKARRTEKEREDLRGCSCPDLTICISFLVYLPFFFYADGRPPWSRHGRGKRART